MKNSDSDSEMTELPMVVSFRRKLLRTGVTAAVLIGDFQSTPYLHLSDRKVEEKLKEEYPLEQ